MLENLVAPVLNRYLATYVEGLDGTSLNVGLWSGDVKLRNLRLKKEALDKFRLPVNVIEGHLGTLTLSIPWSNLKGKPVKIAIDNVYLLAVPAADSHYDPDEDRQRAQAAKMEKLATSELLTAQPTPGMSEEDEAKNESFTASLVNRIVDNVQISIQNIHIRYEDKLSVPGHPFAAGLTLSGFTAESTDGSWNPTFLVNNASGVHKLAKLQSLAIYFDTDAPSIAGLAVEEAIAKFNDLIATDTHKPDHQFILKPVSGEGRLVLNRHFNATTPKTDAQLLFKELGFVLDSDQYRDALSMVDLFHFYTRQHQYRPFRPPEVEYTQNRPRALFKFASQAILSEVHQKHQVWTWDHFRQRRDDRKDYIRLFKTRQTDPTTMPAADTEQLDALERKLSLRDLKLYRSMARSEMRKDRVEAARLTKEQQALHPNQQAPAANRGWLGWVWGGSKANDKTEQPQDLMSAEQRKELYETIDWDEERQSAAAGAIDAPRDSLNLRVTAKLDTGSFVLRRDPRGKQQDMMSILFDAFSANIMQRTDNFDAEVALAGMRVYDGTREGTKHAQIVAVKAEQSSDSAVGPFSPMEEKTDEAAIAHPFFYAKFEKNPLDGRADTGLTVKLRYMEIFYHAGYLEAIVAFFKPPASQLESVSALVDVASETLEGLRKETRAGLEYALQNHKTVDLRVDMNAPIIIIPENITKDDCVHMVVDAGRITVSSDLANQEAMQIVRDKAKAQYSEEDWLRLEGLMYDKFHVEFKDTQVLLGTDLKTCMDTLAAKADDSAVHLLRRVNMTWRAERCILPQVPNLTAFKVAGHLPELAMDFSDAKYRNLMKVIDQAVPHFDGYEEPATTSQEKSNAKASSAANDRKKSFSQAPLYNDDDDDLHLTDDEAVEEPRPVDGSKDDDKDQFFEAPDLPDTQSANVAQKKFQFEFSVDRLSVAISKSQPAGQPDLPLAIAVLSGSRLLFVSRTFDMHVDIALRSLEVEDRMVDASQATFKELVSSDVGLSTHATDAQDLVTIKYTQCQQDSPEFMTVHEGFNKIVDVNMNALNIIVTRGSILVLFDFVLATFTNPEAPAVAPQQTQNQLLPEEEQQMIAQPQPAIEKMRVKVKLNSIVLILNNDGDRLATLELSAADVSVLLRGPTLRVTGRLGNLFIADDTKAHVSDNDDFRKLLQIKGDEVADFTYETYSRDINAGHSYPGYDAHVVLRTGSLQLTFLEEPLHHLLRFLTQFARMKAILDAARMAATNQVAVATKMSYDVAISTPILLFPRSSHSADLISAHLGAITARNDFVSQDVQRIEAGLRSIKLISHIDDKALDMLEDLNLEVKVAMTERIAREADLLKPDVMVDATLQDVKMALTQQQYALLMALSHTVPRTFSTSESEQQEDAILLERTPMASRPPSPPQALSSSADLANGKATVDLLPELPVVAHTPHGDIKLHSATEVSFKVNAVSLDLYGPDAVDAATLKSAGLIRFALNDTKANVKILNDGSMEAELGIRSFRIVDTNYSRSTKWRDIVPASKHHGANRSPRTNDGSPLIEGFDAAPHQSNQLMLSYSVSSGSEKAAVANLTLDTPTLIFSLEPLFALAAFATSPFSESNDVDNEPAASEVLASRGPTVTIKPPRVDADAAANATSLAFRVNVVDARIILLADPERSDSEAIVLSVSQFEMVQQSILVLHTTKLGMALCKMDRPSEKASFLDEMDITLSMDNRPVAGGQSSSIEMEFRPIVLRVSFRDMMLAKSIINRAIELLGTQQPASPSSDNAKHRIASTPITTKGRRTSTAVGKPKVIMARENLKATFDGFQLILIGDMHELPMIDVKTEKFMVRVTDWSKDLRAGVIVQPFINFFNLSTSHWEPLVDPWEFQLNIARSNQKWTASIESAKRLELNITATFINIAGATLSLWSNQGAAVLKTTRGSNAPFLIRNRTGHTIQLWSESQKSGDATTIASGKDVPWRFDDWRTMRENVMATTHNSLALTISDTAWEKVQNISIDQEGEHIHPLKPKLDNVTHRLCCDVQLTDNVKIITFRSTFKVENLTLVPVEMAVVKSSSSSEEAANSTKVFKIAPGQEGFVPIASAYEDRIRLRPDAGFKYAWSAHAYHWQELVKRPSRTIICHSSGKEVRQFFLQAYAEHDRADPMLKRYPRLTLKLRPPIELENCLPFNFNFRLYDKAKEHNYRSYVRKGGVSPLHVADLTHLTLLSVELEHRWFKQSEFAIVVTDNPDDLPIESTLQLEDKDGLQLPLRMNYIRHPNAAGAFKLQVHAPFVIVNKIGEALALKYRTPYGQPKNAAGMNIFGRHQLERQQGAAAEEHGKPEEETAFLFAYPNDDRRNRALLRVKDSEWSNPLSLEAVGTATEISFLAGRKMTLENGQDHPVDYRIGMRVSEGTGSYVLTKVVTLYPRYLITNNLSSLLRLRQRGSAHSKQLEPGLRMPLLDLLAEQTPDVHLSLGDSTHWSAPFRMSDVGHTFLRVLAADGKSEKLLRVEVLLDGACVHLQIGEVTGAWQFTLVNKSSSDIVFWQSPPHLQGDQSPAAQGRNLPARKTYTLKKGATLPYVWDQPCDLGKSISVLTRGGATQAEQRCQEVNVMEIGPVKPFSIMSSGARQVLAVDIRAETDTQVVEFSDYSEESNLFKMQQRPAVSRQQSVASIKDLDFEAVEVDAPVQFSFQLKMEGGLGISLINKRMQELCYTSFRGILLKFVDTTVSQTISFECKWIQIDNQLFGGIFPLLLYPSVIPQDGKELAAHPTIETSVILMKDQAHGVMYFKYATFLLQQMTLEIDEDFIFALIDFTSVLSSRVANTDSKLFDESLTEIPEPQPSMDANDVYFETLHLQPIQLDLSFMRTEKVNTEGNQTFLDNRNFIAWFLNALTMALGNVNDAPIRLNMLWLENVRLSMPVLVQRVALHYQESFMGQLYRVLGSADFLGNPIGLFQNVSSGIGDIFYAPYEGLVAQNQELGHSIAKGASSFVRKTVFGFSDSFAKVSGSIGKGLAAATLDREFQAARRMRRSRNKPKHALYGITGGASAFFNSVASGVEGVVRQPIDGAEKDGAAGFFKGFGKGIVGAVTKPAVGFFDLTNSITEGIRNTTTVFDASAIERVRLPRHIDRDGVLRPFQEREALGQFWLKSLENGKFFDEHYVAHLEVRPENEAEHDLVVILTATRILLIRSLKLKVQWDVPLADLQSISIETKGISLTLRKGVPGPFLALPVQSGKLWLFSHMERVVSAYNQKH